MKIKVLFIKKNLLFRYHNEKKRLFYLKKICYSETRRQRNVLLVKNNPSQKAEGK